MSYAVTVDTSQPPGAPELDPLQRAGVVHLLREGLDAVASIEGEDGEVVEITDHFIGVHPDGALLKVFVDAPSLEDAEDAVGAVIGEILEQTELLSAWTVERCEVQLHLDAAERSLRAADGPDLAPDAVAAADQALATNEGTAAPERLHEQAMRAALGALAPRLAGVAPSAFGSGPDAELAAGALVQSIDTLLDELLEDITTLDGVANAALCEDGLLQLEGLPAQFAHLYTPRFARELLVTAVMLTDRLCRPQFTGIGCVAEELLLRLWLEAAEATLDLHGLLHLGTRRALEAFRAAVSAGLDRDLPAVPGPDGVDDWFTPLDGDPPVHPYTARAWRSHGRSSRGSGGRPGSTPSGSER